MVVSVIALKANPSAFSPNPWTGINYNEGIPRLPFLTRPICYHTGSSSEGKIKKNDKSILVPKLCDLCDFL